MAKKDVLVHLDGNLNELQNWLLHILATDPGSPLAGQLWYNSTDGRPKIQNAGGTESLAFLSDITGAVTFKGGYDAGANTPNLDSSPGAGTINQGDFYYVTAAGNFYTEAVEVGDALIANVDNPASLSDWTRVQFNVDQATEATRGIAEIATQVETDAGTDDTRIVTPLKLAAYISSLGITTKFAVNLDSADANVTRAFAGGQTTFTVTHNLGTTDIVVAITEVATGEQVLATIDETAANTVDIIFNGNQADGDYKVTIVG